MKHLKRFENKKIDVTWKEYFSPLYVEKSKLFAEKCLDVLDIFNELREMEDDGTFVKVPSSEYPYYHDDLLNDMDDEIGEGIVGRKLTSALYDHYETNYYNIQDEFDYWYHNIKYPEKGEARKFNM